jgi:Resolvase, N terminal domain
MKVCLPNVPKRAGSCRTNSTPILNHPPHKGDPVKCAALYLRVSTLDQNPETQGIELRQFALQRGYEIVEEYVDHGVSGTPDPHQQLWQIAIELPTDYEPRGERKRDSFVDCSGGCRWFNKLAGMRGQDWGACAIWFIQPNKSTTSTSVWSRSW